MDTLVTPLWEWLTWDRGKPCHDIFHVDSYSYYISIITIIQQFLAHISSIEIPIGSLQSETMDVNVCVLSISSIPLVKGLYPCQTLADWTYVQ